LALNLNLGEVLAFQSLTMVLEGIW